MHHLRSEERSEDLASVVVSSRFDPARANNVARTVELASVQPRHKTPNS